MQGICTQNLNMFRLLMLYLKPVLPQTALQVESFLNIEPLQWDDHKQPLLNHTINDFAPLLQRIEQESIEAMLAEETSQAESNNKSYEKQCN